MSAKQETALTTSDARDPFTMLHAMTSELERVFDRPFGSAFHWPVLRAEAPAWAPQIDVFERDKHLVTKVDLPGLKKEDVKVEVTDGHLTISGERKTEKEEKKDNFYRSERSFGSFYRAVPLPEGVKLDDVKATFSDGVLEVSIPLPTQAESKVRKVQVEDAPRTITPK